MDGTHSLARASIDKKVSSKSFIALFEMLLNEASISLTDLSFIVVNRGPAPFTSLRVVLAAAAGLHAATHIPLVGVDGLSTFLHEHTDHADPITVALLNAYSNDVYYAFHHETHLNTGYNNIKPLLDELKTRFPVQPIRFIGEGATLYQENIVTLFHEQAGMPLEMPEYLSLDALAAQGYAQWLQQKSGSSHLLPLYLKQTV